MKRFLFLLAKYFDTLKLHVRLTVFLIFASLVIIIFHRFFFKKVIENYHNNMQTISRNEVELAFLQEQEVALTARPEQGVDVEILETIDQVARDNAELYSRIADLQVQFSDDEKMVSVLRDLIMSHKNLELISIYSGQTEDLLNHKIQNISLSLGWGLYRHYIEVTVSGSYTSLVNYVHQLETLSWKVHLNKLSIKAKEYPVSIMKLTLYTLSLEHAWLEL